MEPKVITSSSIKANNFGVIQVQELLPENVSADISVVVVQLSGTNQKSKNKVSTTFYFIFEGSGIFNINDTEYPVRKGDLVMIPKDTFYFDSGEMKMLSFCSPRFDVKNVEYVP